MPLLRVNNLVKRFTADVPVVDDVSFDVQSGEVFVLLGESGCGKTTTLRIVAGFEKPSHGSVHFDGRQLDGDGHHVRSDKRGIGFVFQDYALFPHLTVIENVMYGLKGSKAAKRERAEHVVKLVGLSHLATRKPQQLSGGQQQRVALARTIAPMPRLVLLDEPFSNLDAGMRATMRSEVRRLLQQEGMTAILVTHDQEEALSFADRIGVMHNGRLEQVGRPEEIYRRPATPFVASFLGRTNLFRVHANADVAKTALGTVRLSHRASGDVIVSIRPEHLELTPPQPGRPLGEVMSRVYKGHDLTYRVKVAKKTYEVQTDYRCPFMPGESVNVVPIENAVVLREIHSHGESDAGPNDS